MGNLYDMIHSKAITVGDTVEVLVRNGVTYDVTIRAIELNKFGVYVLGEHEDDNCLVFNHPDVPTCAYVGFEKEEFLSLIDKWLTIEGY
ncbi:hypothetical protein [Vibrio cholerae]|uniref:hypothetical protein n=1 Tax=Vibrio cholerae TaxID=666 RepID=UPI00053C7EDE|nr:hypothetical protein [Vibrio cholerae]